MSCSSNSALSIALLLLSALFICHGAVGVQGSVADFLKEKTGGDQVEILTDASLMESCGYPRECVCDETRRSKGKKMTPCTPLEIQTKCEVCVTDLVIDGRYNKESAIFWKLQQIARGSVQMKRDTAVKMLDFKVLKSIDGELNFGGYPWTCPRALKLFLAPMLKTVGMVGWSAGDVTVGLRDVLDSGTTAGCPELDNLYLPNLEEIGGNFQVQSNPKLKNLYLPKTQGTGLYNGDYKSRQPGDVTITRNGDLKLIYAPKLEAGQSIPSSYLYFDGVPRAAAADMIDETALDNPQGNAANGKLETSAFTDKRRMNSAKMSIAFNDKLKAAVLPRSPYTIYSLGDQKTGLIVLKPGNQSPPFPPQYGTMDEGPEPSGFY